GLPVLSMLGNTACVVDDASNSNLHCWGANDRNQVGDADANSDFGSPIAPAFPMGVDALASVYANGNVTCAIAGAGTSAGTVYCWGQGGSGQMGNNTTG